MPAVVPRVGRPSRAQRAAAEGREGAVLRALSHASRRRILVLLAERPLPVHEIAGHFAVSRPMISKHLRVLVESGLAEGQAAGRERRYRLCRGAFVRQALDIATRAEAYNLQVARLRRMLRASWTNVRLTAARRPTRRCWTC